MSLAETKPTEYVANSKLTCEVCESNMVNHMNFTETDGSEIVTLSCNLCGELTERSV